jgi:hypothetical protein
MSGMRITSLLSLFVVPLVGAGGCSADPDGSGDARAVEAAWSPSTGFGLTEGERLRLYETVTSVAPGGGALWVVGDGISAPFDERPDVLSTDRSWPDVVVPDQIAPDAALKVYTVKADQPVLDAFVTDLVVTSRPDAETPYGYAEYNKLTCYNYCDSGPCSNCRWCQGCYNWGYKYCDQIRAKSHNFRSTCFTCSTQCGNCNPYGSCTGVHHCYSTWVQIGCHN